MKLRLLIALSISLACLTLLLNSASWAKGTSAGTGIEGFGELRYGTEIITSEVTTVEVTQMYGLTLTPTMSAAEITPEGTCYFPHEVENVGNGSDPLAFTLSATTAGWSGQLIVDDNNNGVHEETETTIVSSPVLVAEDAIYYFFISLTAPPSVEGDGSVTLTITSEGSDGGAFYGANGVEYGGDDLVYTIDTGIASFEALFNLNIYRDDASGDITLSWEGGNADVYYIDGTYEASFSGATIEAYGVSSPWTSSAISAQDGSIRYYRVSKAGISDGFAPETVGKFDVSCEAGIIVEASIPLISTYNSIQDVFGTQLTGGFNVPTADRVKKYNPNDPLSPFEIAWLKSSNNIWYTGSQVSTMEINPDDGFEIVILSSHPSKKVTFVGQVSAVSRTIVISQGMNHVGSAYPVTVKLGDNLAQDSNLYESGATPGFNIPSADRVKRYNKDDPLSPFEIAWLKTGGNWYTGSQPTGIDLEPGRSYWVEVLPGHSGFTWTYPKPYTNP